MRQIKINRILQILYPLLVYFLIYQVGAGFLISFYKDDIGSVACLFIAALVCLVPMAFIFKDSPKPIPDSITKKLAIEYVLSVLAVVVLGILINIILTKSGIISYSAGFANASATLTDGSLIIKILCNAIAIPLLEELLMRGIIAGQIYFFYGPATAVIVSTICFGILHNNIVQFIYAVIIGALLGALYVRTKRVSLCVLAHGLINLIAILFG